MFAATEWFSASDATVLVAVCGAAAAILGSMLSTRNKVKNLAEDLQTNHGKKPYEYLEMIHDVREALLDLKEWSVDHTQQDTENFKALQDAIEETKRD